MTQNEPHVPFLRLLIAVLLPPVGVALTTGFDLRLLLNILLTFLGYIPGLVHAVFIIARASGDRERGMRYA